jgi:type II secretory pathway pseudopilin PulG
MQNMRKQKGFSILAVILIVVGIVALLGAWALSGQTNSQSASDSSSDVLASGLAQDAAAVKAVFDTIAVRGVGIDEIIYDPAEAKIAGPGSGSEVNILNTLTGIQRPTPNPAVLVAAPAGVTGFWIYHTGLKLPGIGTAAKPDVSIVLSGIRKGACQKMNERLNGLASDALPPVATGKTEALLLATPPALATPTEATVVDLSGVATFTGWTAGCVATTDSPAKYVFFRVLRAQ